MRKKIQFVVALLLLDILAIGSTSYRLEVGGQAPSKTVAQQVDQWTSQTMAPVSFSEAEVRRSKEIDLSFHFSAHSFPGYPNIFQTAPYNKGLRMELSEPSGLGLIIGLKHSTERGYEITKTLSLNEWHEVKLHYGTDKHLTVDLDGYRALDVTDDAFNPGLSQILVGGGFDSTRSFKGDIKDFKISYSLFKGLTKDELRVLTEALIFLGLALFVFLLVSVEPSTEPLALSASHERLFGTLFLLTLLLLSSTWVYKDFFKYRNLFPPSGRGIDFDSDSPNPRVAVIRELLPSSFSFDGIQLDFKMKPYSFDGYPNVFQTAPSNNGIRMELGSNGMAGFLVGHISDGEIKGCGTFPIKLNEWSRVSIHTDRGDLVQIKVNGNTVFDEHVDGGLHFDMTDIVVGSGFDKTRPFHGAIEDFRLQYQSRATRFELFALRAGLLGCAAILLYFLQRLLLIMTADLRAFYQEGSDVLKFSLKLVLLLIPVMALLGTIEYRLYKMPNNYSQKRQHLERRLNDIGVLVVGSSNAFFGINPSLFSLPGFNIAYRGQAVYYDDQILKRYLDRMPKLKVAIITVVYLTFGTQQYDVDPPRAFLYEHYWGIRPAPRVGRGLDLAYQIDPKRISSIAMYGEATPRYVGNGYQETVDPDPEITGWFNAGTEPSKAKANVGREGAMAHNSMVQVANFDVNASLIQDMIGRFKQHGVRVILVQLPLNSIYTDYIDRDKWNQMENVLTRLADRNHIRYLDYTFDKRFTLNEFTDLPDHMNAVGAQKFTTLLSAEVDKELQSSMGEIAQIR